jgi:hypothetical protein
MCPPAEQAISHTAGPPLSGLFLALACSTPRRIGAGLLICSEGFTPDAGELAKMDRVRLYCSVVLEYTTGSCAPARS